MNKPLRALLATALLAGLSAPASAGDLQLTMANGRVTLRAKDVTVREILAEWARVGQARIIHAEKLTGGPVTLELTDVPEGIALDTVLRSAAGYVMAPRVAGAPGASRYDRILILASSRPPVVAAGNPAPFTARPMPQNTNAVDDEVEFGLTPPAMPMPAMPGQPGFDRMGQPVNGVVPGPPGGLPALLQQQFQPGQPQVPLTAPRPGMLPAPVNTMPPSPNPYLGTPPGPAAPTFNPMPQTPPIPGRPGGQ